MGSETSLKPTWWFQTGFRGSETAWFQRGLKPVWNPPDGFRLVSEGLKVTFFLKEGSETTCFSIHGHPEPSSDGFRGVSEWFQKGLKLCGFRGVSEWSETVWFQRGFRVVWNRVVSEGFQRGLNDFGRRLLKIYCDVSPMIIGETSQ